MRYDNRLGEEKIFNVDESKIDLCWDIWSDIDEELKKIYGNCYYSLNCESDYFNFQYIYKNAIEIIIENDTIVYLRWNPKEISPELINDIIKKFEEIQS